MLIYVKFSTFILRKPRLLFNFVPENRIEHFQRK